MTAPQDAPKAIPPAPVAPGHSGQRRLVWIVVQAKPGQERRARVELMNQAEAFGDQFEVYLPLRLAADRKGVLKAAPFFGRYLFVRIELGIAAWRSIWSTYGVAGVLGSSAGRPYGVADWVIERIRAQEEAGYIRIGLEEEKAGRGDWREGEAVRVAGASLEAVFMERVDEKRGAILVSLLGRDSRVTVDLTKLRSAGC